MMQNPKRPRILEVSCESSCFDFPEILNEIIAEVGELIGLLGIMEFLRVVNRLTFNYTKTFKFVFEAPN